jgi:NAD(P)-dependent dehydrogenase (short-subunit alcohol dehydrogenase family)
MADAAMERYGRLDILDNNVGMSMRGTVVDVSEDDWDRIIAVNVKSMIFASGAAIPYMIKSGGGSIINISSIAGLRAHSQTPYTTTKTAVIGLTFSMAADHGKDNIRVNCIAPGLLHTPMTAPRMNDEQREQRKSAAPLGTEGTGWDVGWAAVFLASEEARWITGIVLPVEAGLTVTSPVTYTTIGQQARF